jgi:hypothetical protein
VDRDRERRLGHNRPRARFVTGGDSSRASGSPRTLARGRPRRPRRIGGAKGADVHPVFGLSLGNTGDSVLLWKVTSADTTLVDSYTAER